MTYKSVRVSDRLVHALEHLDMPFAKGAALIMERALDLIGRSRETARMLGPEFEELYERAFAIPDGRLAKRRNGDYEGVKPERLPDGTRGWRATVRSVEHHTTQIGIGVFLSALSAAEARYRYYAEHELAYGAAERIVLFTREHYPEGTPEKMILITEQRSGPYGLRGLQSALYALDGSVVGHTGSNLPEESFEALPLRAPLDVLAGSNMPVIEAGRAEERTGVRTGENEGTDRQEQDHQGVTVGPDHRLSEIDDR